MHSQSPIIQNQHVHHVLHSIPNVCAQRSHKLRSRIHTARVGTILVPLSTLPTGCSILFTTTCEFYTLMPPEQRSETKFVGRVLPKRLDAVSTCSCRTGRSSVDLAGCFGSSSVPASFLYSLTQTTGPLGSTGGAETQDTLAEFTHAQQSTIGKTIRRERELQSQSDGYKIISHAATNLTHYWLASNLMITPRSSPISSLVPGCNPPKAQ